MSRIGNEIVWAVVASVVCGALLASLLGGTPLPLIVILVAVAAGLAVTTLGRRRERRAYQPATSRSRRRERRPVVEKPDVPRRVVPTDPPARALVDPSARRTGARAQSLGAQPGQGSDPPG